MAKSKKKKNTYQVQFSLFTPNPQYENTKTVPLPVKFLNGIQQQLDTKWIVFKEFHNPCAYLMTVNFPDLRSIMGAKISTTIIEYLDKSTGEPVLQLYPDMIHVFDGYESDYMSHLNHASRRDLDRQISLRDRLISEYMLSMKKQNKR